ncbi:hypothetical protein J3F83DRAFT_755364 [Trichoderma novae-zelandiae]
MHRAQPRTHAPNHHAAPAPRPGSTSCQSLLHFTTHPLSMNEQPFSPHDATSLEAGLHLTVLRSPRRTSASPGRGARTRYYQFFSKFAVEQREIPPQMGVTVLEFDLTQEEVDRLSITSPPSPSPRDDSLMTGLPVSRHFNNSLRYRLRMCESHKNEVSGTSDAATWSRKATHWPPHIFVSVNGEIIHVRRKQHFHHDLPIELTNSLVKGRNKIKVNLPPFPQNLKQDAVYIMAVEQIVTLEHDAVRDLVTSGPHVGVETTKNDISRRLGALNTDEVIIESDALTISVADLFSSTLYDIPVRGRNCLHLECFDLHNWLISRPRKPSLGPGEPTTVDCWNCPLCGMDVRPYNLQVDDFFVHVRNKILASGKRDVKKIEVLVDGSWKAIEEGDEDDKTSDSESAQGKPWSRGRAQVVTLDAME